MDKSVSRTLLYRAWIFVPGGLNAVLVPLYLSPLEQGYYYSFSSLIALQVFFELGLTQVLVFKFAGLNKAPTPSLEPSLEQGRALLSASIFIYRFLGISFFLVAIVSGSFFFNAYSLASVKWQGPWILLVFCTSINLVQSVKLAYLEATGHFHHVSIARLQSSIVASVFFVFFIVCGGGLWAASTLPLVNSFFLSTWLYLHKNAAPYRVIRLYKRDPFLSLREIWLRDVFPMQWKISLSWISGYLIFQLYTPLVFQRLGSAQAGKLGYVITLMSSLVVVATTFSSALAPKLSSLYSDRQFTAFNSVFKRSFVQSAIALLVLLSLVPSALWILNAVNSDISGNFLTPLEATLYAIGAFFSGLSYVLAIYLRAQQDEPLLLVSLVTAVVMVPVLLIAISFSLTCMLLASSFISAISFIWVCSIFRANQSFLSKEFSA